MDRIEILERINMIEKKKKEYDEYFEDLIAEVGYETGINIIESCKHLGEDIARAIADEVIAAMICKSIKEEITSYARGIVRKVEEQKYLKKGKGLGYAIVRKERREEKIKEIRNMIDFHVSRSKAIENKIMELKKNGGKEEDIKNLEEEQSSINKEIENCYNKAERLLEMYEKDEKHVSNHIIHIEGAGDARQRTKKSSCDAS